MKKSSWKANCALAIRMASFTSVLSVLKSGPHFQRPSSSYTIWSTVRSPWAGRKRWQNSTVKLVDGVAFPAEVELLPNDGFLQHSSLSVVFHGAMYSFIYGFAKIHYFLERVPCGYKNLASCILHFIFFMLSGRVEKIVVIIVIINNITN